MDLVAGVKRVVVIMDHCTRDGSSKLLPECSLPLTGKSVVDRLYSDLGVFDFDDNGVTLVELAPEVTVDRVKERTDAALNIAPGVGG